MGQKWVKSVFLQMCSRAIWDASTSFFARLEHVVTRCGPWKTPKCLENEPFWKQKRVNKWVKNVFLLKVILDHWGCPNK